MCVFKLKDKQKLISVEKSIYLTEGWVNFHRYQCKEGYIDRRIGDSINNPNSSSISIYQINSYSVYYRCNNGEWLPEHKFKPTFLKNIINERLTFTSDELFSVYHIL